jgi:hypothetical protein
MPAYSSNFKKKVANPVSSGEQSVIMLIINQADLETPIYIVNDRQDLVSNGITYLGCGFNITLPSDPSQGDPTATLSIDNVSQEIMPWLEVSNGAPGTTVTIQSAMRSAPNVIEWSITLNLINITATNTTVSGTLAFNNLATLSATNRTYSPQIAPGLY